MREMVANGCTVADVAAHFGVCIQTVGTTCRGIPRQRVNVVKDKTLEIVSDLLKGTVYQDIADKHGVTKQWVEQINAKCRDVGIPVPERNKTIFVLDTREQI